MVGRYGLDREGLLGKCTVMYAKGCQTLGLVKSRARLAPLRGIKKTETQKKRNPLAGESLAGFRGFVNFGKCSLQQSGFEKVN